MCRFDEKLVNLNFKIIKFFRQHFFGIPLLHRMAAEKILSSSWNIVTNQKSWKEGWNFAQLLGQRNRFSFSTDHTFYALKSLRFHFNKKFPPHKFVSRKTLVSLFYVTVHLILIMLFRNALNHAFEFKENCFHNKRGHWKKEDE